MVSMTDMDDIVDIYDEISTMRYLECHPYSRSAAAEDTLDRWRGIRYSATYALDLYDTQRPPGTYPGG